MTEIRTRVAIKGTTMVPPLIYAPSLKASIVAIDSSCFFWRLCVDRVRVFGALSIVDDDGSLMID
jgi:hypothetical protein